MKKILLGILLVIGIIFIGCAQPAPSPAPAAAPAPASPAAPGQGQIITPAPAPAVTSTPTKKPEPIVLSAVSMHARTEARVVLLQELLYKINDYAKGELRIEYKGGPEAIPAAQQADAVMKGVVFMAHTAPSIFEAVVPSAPFLNVSMVDHLVEMNGGAYGIWREAYAKANLLFLGRTDAINVPSSYLGFKKAVKTPAELKGLKFAAATAWLRASAESLGMSYSVVPQSEAYSAMDTGVFDGFGTTPTIWVNYSMHEVLPYVIDHPIFYAGVHLITNLQTFKGLPDHLQKIILDSYAEFEPRVRIGPLVKENDDAIAAMRAKETFIKFSGADAEYFIDTTYRSQIKKLLDRDPVYGPRLLKPLGIEKYAQ